MTSGASTVEAAKREVAAACRVLGGRGVTRGAFGHVSRRLDDGTVLVKGRGAGEEELQHTTPRDIVHVDATGAVLAIDHSGDSGDSLGVQPPRELPIHLAIYAARSDVTSVIHAHPRWVVALYAAGHQLLPLFGAYDPTGVRLFRHGMPTYPRSILIDDMSLGRAVAELMGDSEVCILEGHGIVVTGESVPAATANAVALNEVAHVNLLARSMGAARPIDADDLQAFEAMWERGAARARQANVASFWRAEARRFGEGGGQ